MAFHNFSKNYIYLHPLFPVKRSTLRVIELRRIYPSFFQFLKKSYVLLILFGEMLLMVESSCTTVQRMISCSLSEGF